MNSRRLHLLLLPAFVCSTFLLLLNDISFKYEFHNWFTGKLSDFTGLFALSIFLLAFFPRHRNKILTTCGVFFIWWKSPLSSYFIESWNLEISLTIARVIDYTDLSALMVLPIAGYMAGRSKNTATTTPRPVLIAVISTIALFSFCFTSMPRYAMYYSGEKNEVKFYGQFSSKRSEEQILQQLSDQHISFHKDSFSIFPYQVSGDQYFLRIKSQEDSTRQWMQLPNNNDSALYIKRKESPFYIIPVYYLDGDELRNVKIGFNKSNNNKKTVVNLTTFQSEHYEKLQRGKLRRKYKRHFKELFK